MAIALPTKREQQIVEDALRNPEGAFFLFGLSIDDLECGDKIVGGEWGSDGGSLYLDVTLALRVPLSYYDAPSSYVVFVNGVAVPQMAGIGSRHEVASTADNLATTDFLARSARAEAQSVLLGQVARWPGVSPNIVVRDVFNSLPYAKAYTRIDPLSEPILYFQEPDAHFWPEQSYGDVLKRVEEQTPYKIRDNAYGGGVAQVALEPTAVKDFRVYNARDFVKWRPPPPADNRYNEVVVFRRNQDGTNAFEPQSAPVHYPNGRPPLKGSALWLSLDDTTDGGAASARNLAYRTATQLSRGLYKDDSVILPFFDPLLEIQDVFQVYETWEDEQGLWDRRWLCWVESFKHHRDTLQTEVSYSALLTASDEIKVPVFPFGGASHGVKKSTLEVCDEVGGLILIDSSATWALEEDGEITLATGAGTVFEDDGEITIVCPAPDSIELWGPYD